MLAKVILLLVYFLIIFLAARILDITSSWLEAGCLASQFFDPFALSVRKLKEILDKRGISYNGVVEKTELADLVEASGVVTDPDTCLSKENPLESEEGDNEFVFTGASHFFEEVEDTKAGSWLVEVIPQGYQPVLNSKQWKSFKHKIAWFGIRMGTFKCENDPWLCYKYRWNKTSIILSMPQSNQPKGNVIIQTYDTKKKLNVDRVFRWVNSKLSDKIMEIDTIDSFRENLGTQMEQNYIYVALFTTLPEPPMFLSSLSIKFTGRVRFAYYRSQSKRPLSKELRDLGVKQIPTLMLFTPEGKFAFGDRKGEKFDYGTMDLFLKTLHPEVNDLFLAALCVVNLCCLLELFLMRGGLLRRTFQLLCLLTFYNTSLIILSLPIIGLFQLPGLSPILNAGLKFCRSVMSTDVAAIIRNDFLLCINYRGVTLAGYFAFGALTAWIRRKYKCYFRIVDDDDEDDPNADWLTQDLNYFSRLIHSLSQWHPQINYSPASFEDGFDMLVRRLAVPDLWLHPVFPTDYIKNLPTWTFCRKHEAQASLGTTSKDHSENSCTSCVGSQKPPGIMISKDCTICLEEFTSGATVLGLPCGHCFHQQCIGMWLTSGGTIAHHCCPICRWPAYRSKPVCSSTHTDCTQN